MEPCKEKLIYGRKLSKRSVFLGAYISTENKREPVAIKIEYVKTKNPQLLREAKIYGILKGGTGIPNVISFEVKPGYSILVMPLLGPNLEALFRCCSGKFSLKTVLMLAEPMLNCVEFIHSKSILHRDIQPDNFLMGSRCNAYQVNVVDFGRAKKYQDLTEAHIPCRDNIDSPRNAIYASLNAHLGIEQSRRDDLESLGYVLMYFLKGSLPWQELKAENKKQEFKMIGGKKVSTSIEELCEGCPPEFVSYFHYCRSLKFDEKPDYAYLKKLFRDLFISKGFHFDYVFDWTMLKYQLPVMAAPKVENGVGTLHEKLNKLFFGCIILLTIYVLFSKER